VSTTQFRLLGPVTAVRDGKTLDLGRRRERCLLALLVLNSGMSIRVDRLLDLLWDGDPTPNARASLHTHVSRLRTRLGGDVRLIARDGGYLADVEPATVDAKVFAAQVKTAAVLADPARRAGALCKALDLWAGPVMADVASERLRDRVASGLTELRQTAGELLVDTEIGRGNHDQVLARLFAVTAEHPLHERPAGQLMLALYRAGRQPDALRLYHRLRTRLAEELGADPGPDLQQLYTAILRHDPGLAATRPPARAVPPPAVRPAAAADPHAQPRPRTVFRWGGHFYSGRAAG
jgi:DNA-binding SARP family transcriptional activator